MKVIFLIHCLSLLLLLLHGTYTHLPPFTFLLTGCLPLSSLSYVFTINIESGFPYPYLFPALTHLSHTLQVNFLRISTTHIEKYLPGTVWKPCRGSNMEERSNKHSRCISCLCILIVWKSTTHLMLPKYWLTLIIYYNKLLMQQTVINT